MKKFIPILAACVFLTLNTFAQSPDAFKYQTVVRDGSFNFIGNQVVGMQMTILQGTPSGTIVYQETFSPVTNAVGLVNLEIGSGSPVSGVLANVNWNDGPYYLRTELDPTGGSSYNEMGTSQLLSVPYSLYSKSTAFADSADYNSLSNKPTTITAAQVAKIDSITVTSAVNLDQITSDVAINNSKVSFPGFGTTAGTTLEGNNAIWIKKENDLFYDSGRVAVNVDTNSSFRGSALHVGGGILYDGIPTSNTPGMLYYDTTNLGSFRYYDNANNEIVLGAPYKWSSTSIADTVNNIYETRVTTTNDVVIDGSLGIGNDIVNGEVFGFNSLILKENNLRILFDDADSSSGTYPANDWQIEINEANNGGTSHFAVKDITGSTTPFKIMASAPDNSIFVKEDGKIGVGTNTPSTELHVNGTVKATSFVGDGSGLTGITGGTGGLSNIDTTIIGADTNANLTGEIVFQTQNITRVTIANDGKVGIGTNNPSSELEVSGTAGFQNVNVSGQTTLNTITYNATNYTSVSANTLDYDVTNKSFILFNSGMTQTIDGFMNGVAGQEITISTKSGTVIINHNGGGSQKIFLPGANNKTLIVYSSAQFICDGTNWYCTSLNN